MPKKNNVVSTERGLPTPSFIHRFTTKNGGAVAVNTSTITTSSNTSAAPAGYEVRGGDLYRIHGLETIRLCNAFQILGKAVDAMGNYVGIVIKPINKEVARFLLPFDAMRDPSKLARCFEGVGISMPIDASELRAIAKYIHKYLDSALATVLSREGIHWLESDPAVAVAVMGEYIIAPEGHEELALALPSTPSIYARLGSLQIWKKAAKPLMMNNPVVIAVIVAALSAPFKALFNLPLLSLLLAGQSGSGKTTLARFVNSLFGYPNDPYGWSGTANAIEALAIRHTDAPLPLDEMAEGSAESVLDVIYRIHNGIQKSRANSSGDLQQPAELRTVIIATSEVTLSEHAKTGRRDLRLGHQARMPTIWLDESFGCFSSLNGFREAQELPLAMDNLGRDCHGVVWLNWIQVLVTNYSTSISFIKNKQKQYAQKIASPKLFPTLSPFERRVLDGATTWALAGELAIWHSILPLPEHAAVDSIAHVYGKWLARHRSLSGTPSAAILEHVRDYFQRNHRKKFVDIENWATEKNTIDGYTLFTEKHGLYLVFPKALEEVCSKYGLKATLKTLDDAGYLSAHKGGKTWLQRMPSQYKGQRMRFYAIRTTILFEA